MKVLPYILAVVFTVCAHAETPAPKAPAKTTARPKSDAKTPATAGKTLVADVDGIVCSFCVQGIQKIFKSKGKADEVVISLELKKVFVAEKEGQTISDEEFAETIRHAGFKTISITRSKLSLTDAKERVAHHMPLVAEATGTKASQTAAR